MRIGNSTTWTYNELEVMYDMYPSAPMSVIKQHLPGRSMEAIYKEAERLGLSRPKGPKETEHHRRLKGLDTWQLKRMFREMQDAQLKADEVEGRPRWTPLEMEILSRSRHCSVEEIRGELANNRTEGAINTMLRRIAQSA